MGLQNDFYQCLASALPNETARGKDSGLLGCRRVCTCWHRQLSTAGGARRLPLARLGCQAAGDPRVLPAICCLVCALRAAGLLHTLLALPPTPRGELRHL